MRLAWPSFAQLKSSDREVTLHPPRECILASGQLRPKLCSGTLRIGQDQAAHLAAAHQPIVPTEVVVEQQFERRRLAGAQRQHGTMLDFSLQAAAAKGALDATVRVEERLGTDLLRAGTPGTSDNAERHRLSATGGSARALKTI